MEKKKKKKKEESEQFINEWTAQKWFQQFSNRDMNINAMASPRRPDVLDIEKTH